MPMFKVGDKVKCIDNNFTALKCDVIYTVDAANLGYVELKDRQEGWLCASRFEKADLSLEDELEATQKQLYDTVGQVNTLEQRIESLQQAIKERDKPKGRVGIKDATDYGEEYYLVCADGGVRIHHKNFLTSGHVSMGNLFYDRESAEQYVHDRKQAVLRGDV